MYLSKCIDSILSQSYSNFELLLIDDGSTDKSGQICDEYAKTDSRIRVFHQTNKGVGFARNVGLDNAKGEFIHFVDPDDFVLQGAYLYLEEICKRYSPDVICFNNVKDATYSQSSIKNDGKFYNSIHDYMRNEHMRILLWIKIFKKKFIETNNVRFEPLFYSQDTVFCFNLFRFNGTLYHTTSTLYSYTTNPNSTVQVRRIEHVKKTINSMVMVNMYLKEYSKSYLDCPPIKHDFAYKYIILFNRILCTPYSYKELKTLFSQCKKIGISHFGFKGELKIYDHLYHHPLFYYLLQGIIRKVYFLRHKNSNINADFIEELLTK